MIPQKNDTFGVWWGKYRLEEGQAGCWNIGPATIWIYRQPHEWRIVHRQEHDPLSNTSRITLPLRAEEADASLDTVPREAIVSRFSFRRPEVQLSIHPALGDRPMVIRPERPLYVLGGEEVTLYVSTPLWMRIEAGEPLRLLQELPLHRPSDTWFGPSTREGELCYATRTAGRLNLAELPLRFHRAVTPMVVQNRAADALLVERVQLPVEYLSLYEDSRHYLWTQPVTLERSSDGHITDLHLGTGAPSEAVEARLLRGPRLEARTSLIRRTLSSIFSKMWD